MTHDELCDGILWGFHEQEQADTTGAIHDITYAAAQKGVTDPRCVEQAGEYLNELGLLDNFDGCGGSNGPEYMGNLSARAVRIMERLSPGDSIMAIVHAPRERPAPPGTVYHGTVFQGDVHGSNVVIDSRNAKQSITTGSDLTGIIQSLIIAIREAPGLTDREREEALADAGSLKDELAKDKPNRKIVGMLLDGIKFVKDAGPLIAAIWSTWTSSGGASQ